MNRFRRKLAFQLTPLLDLLLIVIFSQYMDARQKTKAELRQTDRERQQFVDTMEESRQQRDELIRAERLANEKWKRSEAANAQLRKQAEQFGSQIAESKVAATEAIERANRQRDILGQVLGELFRIPPEVLDRAFAGVNGGQASRNVKDVEGLKESIRGLARLDPTALVSHFVKVDELRKRCDVWEIHLSKGGRATIRFNQKEHSFLFVDPATTTNTADNLEMQTARQSDRFKSQVFDYYKTLPQTKSVLILILSYGSEVRYGDQRSAIDGMKNAAIQIRADSGARVRVEYTVLGEVTDEQSSKSGP